MRVGDKIRVQRYMFGQYPTHQEDFIIEEFRFALGFFESDAHRVMGKFTPLCDLYERGPESENKYMPNEGEYTTNLVPAWMDLPRDEPQPPEVSDDD